MRYGFGAVFSFIVVLAIAGAAWWLVSKASFGHPVAGISLLAVAIVGVKVFKKIRRTRHRAEDAFPAKLANGELHVEASKPGLSQNELNGRLHGIRDAKQAKRLMGLTSIAPQVTFNVPAGIDQRWIGGYRGGVAEILPDAYVNVEYRPQRGSTIA